MLRRQFLFFIWHFLLICEHQTSFLYGFCAFLEFSRFLFLFQVFLCMLHISKFSHSISSLLLCNIQFLLSFSSLQKKNVFFVCWEYDSYFFTGNFLTHLLTSNRFSIWSFCELLDFYEFFFLLDFLCVVKIQISSVLFLLSQWFLLCFTTAKSFPLWLLFGLLYVSNLGHIYIYIEQLLNVLGLLYFISQFYKVI